MRKIINRISIERPLIFLCGPYSNSKSNKRAIFSDYIVKKFDSVFEKENQYRPVPFIVDDLFDPYNLGEYHLNLSLLEEIVSMISFRSYIFLDTMSTSMEFGLFSSNSLNNTVKVMIPYDGTENLEYRPSIGEFINLSIRSKPKDIDAIYYDALINEKGFTTFKNNVIPEDLTHDIDKDIMKLKSEINRKIIFNSSDIFPKNLGEVNYSVNQEEVVFYLEFKTLFYFVTNFADELLSSSNDLKFSNQEINKLIKTVSSNLFELFLLQDDKFNYLKTKFIFNKPNIRIKSLHNYHLEELVRHMLSIVKLIEISNRKSRNKVRKIGLSSLKAVKESTYFDFFGTRYRYSSLSELFALSEEDNKVIKSYNNNQDKYVVKYTQVIKGKKRRITTYSDNKYGLRLRMLHKKLLVGLDLLVKFHSNSYAFKNNTSILDCIENHKFSNYFLKMDISNYYGSIKYKNMEKLFRIHLDENPHTRYLECFIKEKQINWKPIINYQLGLQIKGLPLKEILHSMFYKYKLPFGYITSPKLSDIFLNILDFQIEDKDYAITRYADDFLVSCKIDVDFIGLKQKYNTIEYHLLKQGLEVNKFKTLFRKIEYEGESIKFLGLNLVKNNSFNRITIGKRYLIETSKMYSKYLKTPNNFEYIQFVGRVFHIKNNSLESYEKLQKIIKIKTGTKFSIEPFLSRIKYKQF